MNSCQSLLSSDNEIIKLELDLLAAAEHFTDMCYNVVEDELIFIDQYSSSAGQLHHNMPIQAVLSLTLNQVTSHLQSPEPVDFTPAS